MEIVIVGIICFVMLVVCLLKVYRHEKWQNQEIHLLHTEINFLKMKIESYVNPRFKWKEDAYNYFAIGNSITLHGKCNYWWNECGMAASSKKNDYFHQTTVMLEKLPLRYRGGVFSHAYNFARWETMGSDRAECLELLDGYLSTDLSLITIQLGENITDASDLKNDYKELISYIKGKAINAKIIIIGDFWMCGNRDTIKKEIADEMGVLYVSLEEIADKKEYQCGLGSMVCNEAGKEYQVEHKGVARHPNDLGMKYIAEAIISVINREIN